MSEIGGFIIANRNWDDVTKLNMGKGTLASTEADAWRRHVGHEKAASPDFPIYIQRWSDRGWGPHKVTLALSPSPPSKG